MFDAVVIGAGPAGAAAAQLLAKAGWSIALVEKAAFPRRKVCGEFISAATLPVLEACGVADRFAARAGPPIRRVAAYAGSTMIDAPLPSEAGWGRALDREHLDLMLRDAAVAEGARPFQPAEVTALNRSADGYAVTLRTETGEEKIAAGIVIAACGSWNTRGPFAVAAPPGPSDLFAFKAHFRDSALPQDLIALLAFPGGYGGMVHSDGGRISLTCCVRRDALARARSVYSGRAADAVFAHIAAHTSGTRLALRGAIPEGTFLSAGPIHPGVRTRYANGMFFTGNIAGEAHPIIAEGISMAIQSSGLLARCLIESGAAAGAEYGRAWRKQFGPRLAAASLFAHCAMQDQTRAAAALMIRAFPGILTWGAALSGKAAPVPETRPVWRGRKTAIQAQHDA